VSTSNLANKIAAPLTQPPVLLAIALLIVGAISFHAYQRLILEESKPLTTAQSRVEPVFESPLEQQDIINMNLFGTPPTEVVEPDQSPQDIPETNLRLALKGAFTHSIAEKASALIAPDLNSKATLFFINSDLPGGAKLEEVHASYVIIRRNGQREKLQFQRNQPNAQTNSGLYDNYQPQFEEAHSFEPTEQYYPYSSSGASERSADGSTSNSSNPGSLAEIRERLRQRDSK